MCQNDDNRFFVYLHRRASDNKVFYVGKGTGRRHLKAHGRNQHWHNVAKKHGWSHDVVFSGLSHAEALELEKDTILEMLYFSQPLTNKNAGGTGFSGWKMPAITRKRIGAAVSASFTPERRDAYSKMISGRVMPVDSRKKLSEAKRCMKIHKWENIATGEVVEMTQHDFRQAYGLNQAQTTDLARGAGTERAGWKISGTEARHEKDRRLVVNIVSGEILSLSRIELCSTHNVESSDTSRLFSGKKLIAKGFALLESVDEVMSVRQQIDLGFLVEVDGSSGPSLVRARRIPLAQ